MVLTKAQIAENLFEKFQLTKNDSKQLVEFFFDIIKDTLEKGEEVKLSGFGNFQLKIKKERLGRNPRTGTCVFITGRRVVTFKAGHKLKNRVNPEKFKDNT